MKPIEGRNHAVDGFQFKPHRDVLAVAQHLLNAYAGDCRKHALQKLADRTGTLNGIR